MDLTDIAKHTNKVLQVVLAAKTIQGDALIYTTHKDGVDLAETLSLVKKDIDKTAKTLIDFQAIINTTENGVIKELDQEEKRVDVIFGDLLDDNKVVFSGVEFYTNQSNNHQSADLKNLLATRYFDVSYQELNKLIKLAKLKDQLDAYETALYSVSLKSAVKVAKKAIEIVGLIHSKRALLSNQEQKLFAKAMGSSRSMVDFIMPSSTFVSAEGIDNCAKAHKKDIDVLLSYVKKGKYIGGIEIDPTASSAKTLQVIQEIENLELNVAAKMLFKVRKLGNYNALGIHFPGLKIVAVDVKTSESSIHEICHLIDLHQHADNKERNLIADYFRDKVVVTEKASYYQSREEIIARLGEVAFELFFRKCDEGIISQKRKDLLEKKGVYFDFENWSETETNWVKEFYADYFFTSAPKTASDEYISKRVVRTKKIKLPTSSKTEKEREAIYLNVNGQNIDECIRYNEEHSLLPPEEFVKRTIRDIHLMVTHKRRMYVDEWVEAVSNRAAILSKVFQYAIDEDGIFARDYIHNALVQNKYMTRYIHGNILCVRDTQKSKKFFREVLARVNTGSRDLEFLEKFILPALKSKSIA